MSPLFTEVSEKDESLLEFVDRQGRQNPRGAEMLPIVNLDEDDEFDGEGDVEDDDELADAVRFESTKGVDESEDELEDEDESESAQVDFDTKIVEGANSSTVTLSGYVSANVHHKTLANGDVVYTSAHFSGEQKSLKKALEMAATNIARRSVAAQWAKDHPKVETAPKKRETASEATAALQNDLADVKAQLAQLAAILQQQIGG